MHSFDQAYSFVAAFAGDPATAIIDWRAIHDTDKAVAAIPFRGTVQECWPSMCHYNSLGYGIFACISALDGAGRELSNVAHIRAHYIDLDKADARQQYERAAAWSPAPAFAVQSSNGKFHVYWPVAPYVSNDYFTLIQRKLRQLFNADRVIDATRVMRVPGTMHLKRPNEPYPVVMWGLTGWGVSQSVDVLTQALASVNVMDAGAGQRHPLGEPSLAAPSLAHIKQALDLIDPNRLDRAEWIATTAAFKQAGSTLTDDGSLFVMWSEWCARYTANDVGENLKQWNSIRDSELGWLALHRRSPASSLAVGGAGAAVAAAYSGPPAGEPPTAGAGASAMPPALEPTPLDCRGEILTHLEQEHWFKGCKFIVSTGEMLMDDGRFLNVTKFNGAKGGKKFIVDSVGKVTNEPWAAALRSTLWTVPKVDHTRFLPHVAASELIEDDLGRVGVNVYRPARIKRLSGDVTPFLNHMGALLPVASDLKTVMDYIAHNARFPGYKIPWAPVIQSTEGAGKGVLKAVMRHVMGERYVYFPNAKELTDSGSQFNAWMRSKLFILADEIKVDDRRDLIEVLKPMISEEIIEVQGKGHDQQLEDNYSNWLFFTNYRDAIPVNKNGRRYANFYSALQTVDDLLLRGMNETYFKALYKWVRGEGGYAHGASIVADYLLSYEIERGEIPMRAPDTSSTPTALDISQGPIERMIAEAVEDGLAGFRGGWISGTAVMLRIKATGVARPPSQNTMTTILEGLGYVHCGRADRAYFAEDKDSRSHLYYWRERRDVSGYGAAQGYG